MTGDVDVNSGAYLPKPPDCGVNPFQQIAFILGGEDTQPGDFPFSALLGYRRKALQFDYKLNKRVLVNTTTWGCAGTLINRWYIVTAAHCQGRTARSQIVTAALGEWQVGSDPDCLSEKSCLPKLQKFDITPADVTVHPDYEVCFLL